MNKIQIVLIKYTNHVTNVEEEGLYFDQYRIVSYIHELEPVCGDPTVCDGLVDKTNIPLLVAYLCTYFIIICPCMAGYHKDYKYCTLKQKIFYHCLNLPSGAWSIPTIKVALRAGNGTQVNNMTL